MTESGWGVLRRRWSAFWQYERPGPRTRALLLGLVAAALLTDALLRAASSDPAMSARPLVGTFATVSMAAIAWRPPFAVVLMIAGGVLTVAFGGALEYLLAMAVALGLVAVTTSLALTGVFAATIVALMVVQLLRVSDGLTIGAAAVLSVLGLGSFIVGRAFREQRERSRAMRRALHDREAALEGAVHEERQRIADELHDIVAHEITIVVMHARAMEHTDDPETLRTSREAITRSAVQALADIRRMLKIAPPEEPISADTALATGGFDRALDDCAADLRAIGVEVVIDFPDDLDASHTVMTTLVHVAREACRNVLKHAANATRVRVEVRHDDAGVLLKVNDDSPQPASLGVPASGYGLARMAERVALLGGELEVGPGAPGWRVSARIPLTR